ncbi:MAG TPA: hypothetical protein VMA36_02060 [Candidatus Limnocylindria bacterium]|nr:hypothetical protein [Candidatus Limnocylindria bacterium]
MMLRVSIAGALGIALVLALCGRAILAASDARGDATSRTVPVHVLTGMHELCYQQPCYRPPQQVPLPQTAPWLTWAMADVRVADQARRLGIRTYAYLDPSIQYDPKRDFSPLYSEDDNTFLRGCDGRRATLRRGDLSGFLMNQSDEGYRTRVRRYVDEKMRGHYDALFVDDIFAATDTFATITNRPCGRTFQAERAGTAALFERLAMPIIFNGLSAAPDDGRTDPHAQGALELPRVLGGMFEFCLTSYDDSMDHTFEHKRIEGAWLSIENSHLETVAKEKLFFCYSTSGTPGDSPAGLAERAYVYASFLLVYRPQYSVLEMNADMARRRLSVFPEAQIVALDPVQPQPDRVDALRTPSGAYVREYRRCYLAGRDPQPCAAVVNPARASVTLALPGYRHALTLRGGAASDGGTLSRTAPAPGSLGPASGTVLFR